MLASLGVVQGALEVYQRLELWEEVAACYQAAGRKGRAEEVVRERLEEQETPTLWCILGDVTQVQAPEGEEEELWDRRGGWLMVPPLLCRTLNATGRPGSSPTTTVPGHKGAWGCSTSGEKR